LLFDLFIIIFFHGKRTKIFKGAAHPNICREIIKIAVGAT
jgi:hypothetical protein